MNATSGLSIDCGGSMWSINTVCSCNLPICQADPIIQAIAQTDKDPYLQIGAHNHYVDCTGSDMNYDRSIRLQGAEVKKISSKGDLILCDCKLADVHAIRDVFLLKCDKVGSVKSGRNIHSMQSNAGRWEAKGDIRLYFKEKEPSNFLYVNGKVAGNLFPIHPVIYLQNFKVGGAVIFPHGIEGEIFLDNQSSIRNVDETNGSIYQIVDGGKITSSVSSAVADGSDEETGSDAAAIGSESTARSAEQGQTPVGRKKRKRGADDSG